MSVRRDAETIIFHCPPFDRTARAAVAVGAVRAVLVLRGRRLLPVICDVFGVEWALCGRRNKIASRAAYLSEQPAGYAALPVCETRGCCTILLPAMRAGRPQHGLFVFNVGR